jgi:hypothetical protein
MSTQARTPSDHYAEALRLLDVADQASHDPTPVLERIRGEALLEAVAHATLALAPRRTRRRTRHPGGVQPPHTPQSPSERWMFGGDES